QRIERRDPPPEAQPPVVVGPPWPAPLQRREQRLRAAPHAGERPPEHARDLRLGAPRPQGLQALELGRPPGATLSGRGHACTCCGSPPARNALAFWRARSRASARIAAASDSSIASRTSSSHSATENERTISLTRGRNVAAIDSSRKPRPTRSAV